MASFSAALLAGGQSMRMGLDKALLPLPDTGTPMWQRQLRVLEELQPEELFWSGSARPGIPDHVRIVPDEVSKVGPLAGISACLQLLQSDLLVVLAVDLPQMSTPFLQSLLARCSATCGAVVQNGDFFEPLAAIYPKRLADLATSQLDRKEYALQLFVRKAISLEALQVITISKKEAPLFKNLNTPSDLQGL